MFEKIIRPTGWGLMLFLALGIALVSSRYLTADPAVYFPEQKLVYMAHTVGILAHVAGSIVALVLGPWQFIGRWRTGRWLVIHRWLGRIYLGGVVLGGLAGLYMAQLAHGGWITTLGFTFLALSWLATAAMAYTRIRQKDISAHQRWMIRNYALTFAAVTLRLHLPLLTGLFGLEFLTAYRTVAWLSWIPNLLIVEWFLYRARLVD